MEPSRLLALKLISITLSLALSITLLGLISHLLSVLSSSSYKSHLIDVFTTSSSTAFPESSPTASPTTSLVPIAAIPQYLRPGSYWLILAASVGGILDALLALFFTLRREALWKLAAVRFELVVLGLAALRIAVGCAAIVFAFVQYYTSDVVVVAGLLAAEGGRYTEGKFTLEAWACQLSRLGGGSVVEGWCREGRAARWLLVPYVVCSGVLMGLVLVGKRRARGQGRDEKMEDQDTKL